MGVAILRGKGIDTKHFPQIQSEDNATFVRRIADLCCLIHNLDKQNTITIEWVWNK